MSETRTKLDLHGAGVPHHLWDGIERYVEKGIPNGSGLTAVFSGDLFQAYNRCDDVVGMNMIYIVRFIWNHLPGDCWGSPEAVKAWRGRS